MKAKIAVVMGSKSDKEKLKEGLALLDEYKVAYTVDVISAHRRPDALRVLCKSLDGKNVKVVIACAGLSAALPGFIASYVDIPVIGVPMEGGMLDGMDSLLSIIQVPRGVGLLSSGPGVRGFCNAFISALQIIALSDKSARDTLGAVKKRFRR